MERGDPAPVRVDLFQPAALAGDTSVTGKVVYKHLTTLNRLDSSEKLYAHANLFGPALYGISFALWLVINAEMQQMGEAKGIRYFNSFPNDTAEITPSYISHCLKKAASCALDEIKEAQWQEMLVAYLENKYSQYSYSDLGPQVAADEFAEILND